MNRSFKEDFEATVKAYYPFDSQKKHALQQEVDKVSSIIKKLDTKYATVLRRSLDKYARHVREAHSVFLDFVFPIPIPGLTT